MERGVFCGRKIPGLAKQKPLKVVQNQSIPRPQSSLSEYPNIPSLEQSYIKFYLRDDNFVLPLWAWIPAQSLKSSLITHCSRSRLFRHALLSRVCLKVANHHALLFLTNVYQDFFSRDYDDVERLHASVILQGHLECEEDPERVAMTHFKGFLKLLKILKHDKCDDQIDHTLWILQALGAGLYRLQDSGQRLVQFSNPSSDLYQRLDDALTLTTSILSRIGHFELMEFPNFLMARRKIFVLCQLILLCLRHYRFQRGVGGSLNDLTSSLNNYFGQLTDEIKQVDGVQTVLGIEWLIMQGIDGDCSSEGLTIATPEYLELLGHLFYNAKILQYLINDTEHIGNVQPFLAAIALCRICDSTAALKPQSFYTGLCGQSLFLAGLILSKTRDPSR